MFCLCTQVVADLPSQSADSDQPVLRVGCRVWLKDKDLYGIVRYKVHIHHHVHVNISQLVVLHVHVCTCTSLNMYTCT